jgi:thiamine biosynthesis lipoprotein
MGMPITVEIVGDADGQVAASAFQYFCDVDARFSPYKADSELSLLNRGELADSQRSVEMDEVLALSELTRHETLGFFNIRRPDGLVDPSGLVKGWAIRNAARLVDATGHHSYCIEAGGDVQCRGRNEQGKRWRIGIRNPFAADEIVKVLVPGDAGVATSGTYVRGEHIYDPHAGEAPVDDVASITVIGPDIYEADRFATAAFAMGRGGIDFIEDTTGLEGYSIGRDGVATMTSGFQRFVSP